MHQEEYTPERGYFADGIGDPEKWVFRGFILDAMRALDILAAQPDSRYARLLLAEKRALARLSGSEWRRFRVESGYVGTDWREKEAKR